MGTFVRRILIICLLSLSFNLPSNSLAQSAQIDIDESYSKALTWFKSAINEKGIFHYLYDAHQDSYSTKNNAIRQLMASRLLAELANEDKSLIKIHRENLEFIFRNWVRKKYDLYFVLLYDKSKLGANAMLLRTLAVSPLYSEYKSEALKLKNAILASIKDDGSMRPFLVEPAYRYNPEYLLTFYSGEALVALIEYYQREPDPVLFEKIKRSQDYYVKRYVGEIEKNYYPAYVPWHSISLNLMYKITKDKRYAEAAFALNDKLLEIQDTTDHIGRFYNPKTPQYGTPHASSDGVYTEGLVYAYELASLLKDDKRINRYRAALKIAFEHIASLQYTLSNSSHLPKANRAIGAFRIYRTKADAAFSERAGSNIRIDTVQHILDAYRKYLSL